MRIVISALATILIAVQCGSPEVKSEARPTPSATVENPEPLQEKPARSSLDRDTLQRGGAIVLRFGNPHPLGLAVVDPDGNYFYLQHLPESRVADAAAFAALKELRIDERTSGMFYDDGQPVQKKVFAQSGTYSVYLADDLETEPENTNAESLEFWYGGPKR